MRTPWVRSTIKIVKRCFVHELDRIKKNVKERKMRIILNDNMTTETIYIDRVNTFPPELSDVPTAGRRKRFFKISGAFNATKLLIKNIFDISKHKIHTFCGDDTIEVSRTTENTLFVQSIHCNHGNIAMKTNSSGSVLPILTYLCFSMSIAALIGLLVYNRKYQLNLNIPGSNLENLSITLFTSKCIVYVRHRSIHYMECVLHYRSCSSLSLPVCILVHDYICDLHHGETLTDEGTRYTTRRGYCT
jgi:hypothetical protein